MVLKNTGLITTGQAVRAAPRAESLRGSKQLVSEFTSGLHGAEQHATSATSRLRATRLVGVAVGAASHSDPVHAAHVASSKLTKVANDGEKKRRREEKAGVMGGDGVAATARAAGGGVGVPADLLPGVGPRRAVERHLLGAQDLEHRLVVRVLPAGEELRERIALLEDPEQRALRHVLAAG